MASSRGQSEVIGFVLLLAVSVTAISAILLLGVPVLDQGQGQVERDKSELVAGQFHRSVNLVADGGSPSQTVETGGTSVRTHPDQGWIDVSSDDSTLVNESLGTVTFTQGDPQIVYQGGAIIYANDGHAVLRQGPRVTYRDGTLGVTLLRVRGDASTSRSVLISEGPSELLYPNPDAGLTNPVETSSFTVTVHSQYYRAWGRHLADQTGATPAYDSANQTASVTLVPAHDNQPVETGVVAGTPTGTLELTGGVSVDSYNSSVGPYDGGDSSGRVVAAGDVILKGGGELRGGLRADGDVTVQGGSRIGGPVESGGDFTLTGGGTVNGDVRVENDATVDRGTSLDGTLTHGGTVTDPGGEVENSTAAPVSVDVPTQPPVAGHIQTTADLVHDENDNASTPSIDGGRLDCSQNGESECRLSAGQYYLEEFSLGSGEELVFDTIEGDVTVVVDGDMSLSGAATVRTVSEGRVNVYLTDDYRQRGGSKVTNADDNATQFWLYLYPNATADLKGGGEFVGVVYGPGGTGTGAHVEPSIPIYGAVVGDIEFVGGGTGIHYDAALADVQPVPTPDGAASLEYLHANSVQVNVTDA